MDADLKKERRIMAEHLGRLGQLQSEFKPNEAWEVGEINEGLADLIQIYEWVRGERKSR